MILRSGHIEYCDKKKRKKEWRDERSLFSAPGCGNILMSLGFYKAGSRGSGYVLNVNLFPVDEGEDWNIHVLVIVANLYPSEKSLFSPT